MAEPPSPGRGAAPPEQELLGARTAPDAKGSRGSQPAAKKVKGAEERSLKGAKRVNGEGGGGGGSAKQPLPAVVPGYSGPGPWGFATLPSGPSAGAGGFAFPSPLSRKLLPPAVLLPPSASPSSSHPQHQHRHHRHRLALAAEAGGGGSGGSAKPKRPKEKRDKERRKHGALPVVAAAGDGGGALSRDENGEVKLLFPKGERRDSGRREGRAGRGSGRGGLAGAARRRREAAAARPGGCGQRRSRSHIAGLVWARGEGSGGSVRRQSCQKRGCGISDGVSQKLPEALGFLTY